MQTAPPEFVWASRVAAFAMVFWVIMFALARSDEDVQQQGHDQLNVMLACLVLIITAWFLVLPILASAILGAGLGTFVIFLLLSLAGFRRR